uniref:Pleckstrin homology-like domain, family B, member 2a n=1 Tax=Cyprinus carpio TaxID=7962 RepID=A0A8C1YQD0_CYPCA
MKYKYRLVYCKSYGQFLYYIYYHDWCFCRTQTHLLCFTEESNGRGLQVRSATSYLISLGRGFITLIPLTEGECVLNIGFEDAESLQDVTADGPGIQSHHCVITNSAGVITLHPNGNMCHLDGVPVTKPTKLSHGCTLCLGKSFFRFNHPKEANHMKNMLPEKTAGPTLSLSTGDAICSALLRYFVFFCLFVKHVNMLISLNQWFSSVLPLFFKHYL